MSLPNICKDQKVCFTEIKGSLLSFPRCNNQNCAVFFGSDGCTLSDALSKMEDINSYDTL